MTVVAVTCVLVYSTLHFDYKIYCNGLFLKMKIVEADVSVL